MFRKCKTSFVLATFVALGAVALDAKAETEYLMFASDVHAQDGCTWSGSTCTAVTENLTTILSNNSDVELVGLVGDYNGGDPTTAAEVAHIVSAIGSSRANVLAEGNHDADATDDLSSYVHTTGQVDDISVNGQYEIYTIGYTDFPNHVSGNTQLDDLEAFLRDNGADGKALIIMGHYPLHSSRDGDTYVAAATDIFDLLQYWGTKRDIIYFWGHTHHNETADYLVEPGDTEAVTTTTGYEPNVPVGTTTHTWNFAYVNAGFVTEGVNYTRLEIDSDNIGINHYEDGELTSGSIKRKKTWRLTVLDATGSMTITTSSGAARYVLAQEKATGNIEAAVSNETYDALYLVRGEASGPLTPTTPLNTDANYTYFTNSESEITSLIATEGVVTDSSIRTPLVDALCNAMAILESVGDSDDERVLYVVTDGEENQSGEIADLASACADGIDSYTNTYTFDVSPDAGSTYTTSDRSWLTDTATIDSSGRAYTLGTGTTLYDWAGGVVPGSWEWNMYYRVAFGEDGIPDPTSGNATWSSATNDVIVNITDFYDDVDGLLLTSTGQEDVEGGEVSMLTSTFSRTVDMDLAFFDGIAEMTGGTFLAVGDSLGELPAVGDMDEDGDVDETDLRYVLSWFGRSVDTYNQPSIDSDLNNDEFIDNADIAIIRANWSDTTRIAPIPGDIDYNWCVDSADLAQVMQWYGQAVNLGAQHSYHADMNASGFIDDTDVAIVNAHMGEGCSTGGYITQTGTSGSSSSSGTNPCDGFCSDPVTFSSTSFSSGNLGSSSSCYETTAALSSGNCGNFASGRALYVNGTAITCNYQNWTLPAAVNGGYCIYVTDGGYDWAYFVTW